MIYSQLAINILVVAAIYALVGTGFALIYHVTRIFHFAHGAVFTIGAYLAYAFYKFFDLPFPVAALLAVFGASILGFLIEAIVYRPLRRKRTASVGFLLSSLGLYVLLQNIVSIIFGDDTKTMGEIFTEEIVVFMSARVTMVQIAIIATSSFLMIFTHLVVAKTRFGRAMRAISNDIELSRVSGIDSDRVILFTFVFGSALAGIAGILVALDVDMTPTMGMKALMMGVVAVFIGGIGSVSGVAFGALLLGIAQHLVVWKISSQWQDAIVFLILLTFLLIKPEGFMGKKIRKTTV